MDILETQHHLNNMLNNSVAITDIVRTINYEQFVKEEQTKENVYARLQEIGQIAFELQSQNETNLDLDFDLEVFVPFKSAKYNQEIEQDHFAVWSIATSDMPEIGNAITESKVYKNIVI